MIDIYKEIKFILSKHNAVIINGLGGFTAKYKPARISGEKHFSPPAKEIDFKENLHYKDDTIFEWLKAKQSQLTDKEIEKQILVFTSELKEKLDQEEKVHFPGLGYLHKNAHGQIVFFTELEENLLTDAFGLDEFNLDPLPESKVEEVTKESEPEEYKQEELDQASNPVVNHKLDSYFWPIIAFIIIASVIAIAFVVYKNPHNFNLQALQLFKKERKAPIVIGNNQYADTSQIGRTLDEHVKKEHALSYEESKPDTSYMIIAGSFSSRQNAENLQKSLIAKDYPAEIIVVGNSNYRVILESFEDKNKALNAMEDYQEQLKDLDLWLSKLKL